MSFLRCCAASLLLAVSALLPRAASSQTVVPVWYDLQVQGDVAYLLRKSPAEIMRYDLAQEAWLSPVPLAEIPSAFTVDATRLFVGTGRKIERFDLLGGNKAHVTNTTTDVTQLLLD